MCLLCFVPLNILLYLIVLAWHCGHLVWEERTVFLLLFFCIFLLSVVLLLIQ